MSERRAKAIRRKARQLMRREMRRLSELSLGKRLRLAGRVAIGLPIA